MILLCIAMIISIAMAVNLSSHYGWSLNTTLLISAAPLLGPISFQFFIPEALRPSLFNTVVWCLGLMIFILAHPIIQKGWAKFVTFIGISCWLFLGIAGVYDGV